jgi:hypothetical protein
MRPSRLAVAAVAATTVLVAAVAAGAGGRGSPSGGAPSGHEHHQQAAASPTRQTGLQGHVPSLFALFGDIPFNGGQVAPRQYRWVNDNVLIFVQFDRPRANEARALRYVGISVKGTFCAEAQPGGASSGFTHYHRVTAPTYGQGHGGPPGTNTGYWLLWLAVDEFDTPAGRIEPGVDYAFSPTPAPACGANVLRPDFVGPAQHRPSRAEIRQLAAFFPDNPFRGGQTAPRFYRWVNGDVLVWLQFDKPSLKKATTLRFIGIAKRGRFCDTDRGHADFTYFHRLRAATYAKGRGGKRGEPGLWHLALSVNPSSPGVARSFQTTAPPACPKP